MFTGTTEYFDKIQYNGNSENRQHDKILFLRFGYSLVIIRNEMMILLHTIEDIHSVKKHDILVKY